jgi:hypothetical protein
MLEEIRFKTLKESIDKVFAQVQKAFGANEYKSVEGKFSKLLTVREYRESMAVFPDLMLITVDTMMEAGIEVFPNVDQSTRSILQGMFHKYGWYLRVQVFPWFSQCFPIQSFSNSEKSNKLSTYMWICQYFPHSGQTKTERQ